MIAHGLFSLYFLKKLLILVFSANFDNFSYKKYNVPRNAIRNFKKVSKRKKGECIKYEKAD